MQQQQQLHELLGGTADLAQCGLLLDAAGGDVDTAMALFFDQQQQQQEDEGTTATRQPVDPTGVVFARSVTEVPRAWAEQELVSVREGNSMNILQKRNGPCGVLAFLVAQTGALRLERNLTLHKAISDDELALVVFESLKRCGSARWKDGRGLASAKDIPLAELRTPGGAVVWVQALVESRTRAKVEKDVQVTHGELPLIVENGLCSSELMSLLIRGTANGNMSAVENGRVVDDAEWAHTRVGMLSLSGPMQPANALKFPRCDSWIVHGGDHFTVFVADDGPIARDAQGWPQAGVEKKFLFLNGLPPAGPIEECIWVTLAPPALTENPSVPRITAVPAPSYVKPQPGEIDEVIQANPADKKRTSDWCQWQYEVILAVHDPTVSDDSSSQQQPTNNNKRAVEIVDSAQYEPKLGEPWRCAACYRKRFETMVFGSNPPRDSTTGTATRCVHCNQPIAACGWTCWMSYSQLPKHVQEKCDLMFAPKLLLLIKTLWPHCMVSVGPNKLAGPYPFC